MEIAAHENEIRLHKESNLYTDTFTNQHLNKHIIFAGCSITYGQGLTREDTWAYKVYSKISQTESLSGYFNVAMPGASPLEAIDRIYKYIRSYGIPQQIFLFLPDLKRDLNYAKDLNAAVSLVYSAYLHLDTFCNLLNIKLITSTWSDKIQDRKKKLFPTADEKRNSPHWSIQVDGDISSLLKPFDSFYEIDTKEMQQAVFEYDMSKTGLAKSNSLEAPDYGRHPGTSFHDYWADFMLDKYNQAR